MEDERVRSLSSQAATDDSAFDALLRLAAHISSPPAGHCSLPAGTALAAGRFVIVRRIGEGGMGVVYEAFDAQRRVRIALKTLSRMVPGEVYRLKSEFRALADVSHPNVVSLHELFRDGDLWFFTMSLVEGERFDHWVRPRAVASDHGQRVDEARLRGALVQLLDAIEAIHAAGKLHRDLKPSNVLVTPNGHVVVLDFGLAVDPDPGGVGQTVTDCGVAGTPGYMAPEQAGGRTSTAASDLYAVGVMLFEALTGRLPFHGPVGELLLSKQREDAPRASELCAVPTELERIAARLLARDPTARPSCAELRAWLTSALASSGASASSSHPIAPIPGTLGKKHPLPRLLGRRQELRELRDAFALTVRGDAVVVLVRGESGMGKSALCEAFLGELKEHATTTVLAGRCHERENVPFKGFDSLMDDLSRHLRRVGDNVAASVLPRELFALAQVFPVLERVAAVAAAPRTVPDPQDFKRRAFDALHELLARIRARGPLVLVLDDLQWLDRDSAGLIQHLLVHPEPTPLLLLCVHRSEGAEHNALLQAVIHAAEDCPTLSIHRIEVGPLDDAAMQELAEGLLPDSSKEDVDALVHEAQGSPFFAGQIARAAQSSTGSHPTRIPPLSEALATHIGSLPARAQTLLELLALAGQPLEPGLVVDAAGDTAGHDLVDLLRVEQLVRVAFDETGTRRIECYHDKVREHVLASIQEGSMRELATRLSEAILRHPSPDAELLSRTLEQAGQLHRAAEQSVRAADTAFSTLAFERAADLYRRALGFACFDDERARELRIREADALAAAGRGEKAGEGYREAAAHAEGARRQDLLRKAGEQFLFCGDLVSGRESLGAALHDHGLDWPRTPVSSFASFAWSRARWRLTRLAFTPRTRHDPSVLRELEALRSATCCLVRTDQLRAADFSARWAMLALVSGHPVESARALAWEQLMATLVGEDAQRVNDIRSLCARLCEETEDPLANHWIRLCWSVQQIVTRGECDSVLADLDEALEIGSAHPSPGASYDRAWNLYLRSDCMFRQGRVAQAFRLAQALFEDALVRGDHAVIAGLATIVGFGALAADRPEMTERAYARASSRMRAREVSFQDFVLVALDPVVPLYRGEVLEAWERSSPRYERVLTSFQGRFVMRGAVEVNACGVAASAARHVPDAVDRDRLSRTAARLARRAQADGSGVRPGVPRAVLACIANDRAGAIAALRQFIGSTRSALYANMARRRLGVMLGGVEGSAMVSQAERFLRAGGIVHPDRFVAALMPGLELLDA